MPVAVVGETLDTAASANSNAYIGCGHRRRVFGVRFRIIDVGLRVVIRSIITAPITVPVVRIAPGVAVVSARPVRESEVETPSRPVKPAIAISAAVAISHAVSDAATGEAAADRSAKAATGIAANSTADSTAKTTPAPNRAAPTASKAPTAANRATTASAAVGSTTPAVSCRETNSTECRQRERQ